MIENIEKNMFLRFRKLFPDGRNVDTSQSLMSFGFAVDYGWAGLLWECFERLEKLAGDKYAINFIQVKEKFGGLRIYCRPSSEIEREVRDILLEFENRSYETCETCGAPGRLRFGMWKKVRCDDCEIKHEQERGG